MKKLLLIGFVSQLLVWEVNSIIYTNDVITSSGPIRGVEMDCRSSKVREFLGIPYATPPLKNLRFRKPLPVKPWTNPLFANQMPPACMQYTTKQYPYPWYDFRNPKSEDCLYLNIWVSTTHTSRRKPVMFWIHGGGFYTGSIAKDVYNGGALAAVGDVIIVTANYRLSAFGFLTSNTKSAPGNIGLYDILEALKWVHKNIGAFGGDPKQVTVFGESAGSIATSLFCVSPLTKGLFHRVIMQSGSSASFSDTFNKTNVELSQKIAEKFGCADEKVTIYNNPECVVNCLREVDPFEIAKVADDFFRTFRPDHIYWPSFGDEILPRNPRTEIQNGNFHDADVLIGNVRDEGSVLLSITGRVFLGFFGRKIDKIKKSEIRPLLKKITERYPVSDTIIRPLLLNLETIDVQKFLVLIYTILGDIVLLCPDVYFAEKYNETGHRVFFYLFNHRPSTTPWADWQGVAHYEDVQFTFGRPVLKPWLYTPEETNLSLKMVELWTNFAKYGIPAHDWPLYSRREPKYLDLSTGDKPKYGFGPDKVNCDLLRPLFGFIK